MADESFQAWLVDQPEGRTRAELTRLPKTALPEGDVLVRVTHSSLNYKDGLAVTGRGKVVRRFPMVPGIDLAGVVEESGSPVFRPGDRVIATGCGLGERHWGGYAQLARLKSEWLLPLPQGLSAMREGGCVTAVGLAGGAQLNTTVHPFILRAVSLVGISSAATSAERRRAVWSRLTRDLPLDKLERIVHVAALSEVSQLAERILAGQVQGRIVIEVG